MFGWRARKIRKLRCGQMYSWCEAVAWCLAAGLELGKWMTVRAPRAPGVGIRFLSDLLQWKLVAWVCLVRYHQHTEVLRDAEPDTFYNWRNNFYQQLSEWATHLQSGSLKCKVPSEFTGVLVHWLCLCLSNKCIHSWPHLMVMNGIHGFW